MNIDKKVLNKVSKPNPAIHQKDLHEQVKFNLGRRDDPVNTIYQINTRKNKNHVLIFIYPEKAFDKTHYPFMLKTLNKLRVERTFLNS